MATRAENGALGCGGRRKLCCGSEAAERLVAKAGGSRPLKKAVKKAHRPAKKTPKKTCGCLGKSSPKHPPVGHFEHRAQKGALHVLLQGLGCPKLPKYRLPIGGVQKLYRYFAPPPSAHFAQ